MGFLSLTLLNCAAWQHPPKVLIISVKIKSDLPGVRQEGCSTGGHGDLGTRLSLFPHYGCKKDGGHGKQDPGKKQIKIVHVSQGSKQACVARQHMRVGAWGGGGGDVRAG